MANNIPTNKLPAVLTDNAWETLKQFTTARIALGRAGISLPTKHLLEFQLAHASAKDAVYAGLNTKKLIRDLQAQKWPLPPPIVLQSRAETRDTYLQRPDHGRRLNEVSYHTLRHYSQIEDRNDQSAGYDLAIVITDGLSANAIHDQVLALLIALLPKLWQSNPPWTIAPLCLVEQGRVAVGDEIGELLRAKCLLMAVGERPGLSSPNSLGLYLTWAPKNGLNDARRNCISNIHSQGISPQHGASKALYLLNEARRRQISGVELKDHSPDDVSRLSASVGSIPNES